MMDVRAVLAQKERDLERVRREVRALLRAIPLLAEEEPAVTPPATTPQPHFQGPRQTTPDPAHGMAELELYYPFVARNAERK